ncbi:nicotianamine synthase family protein [Paenibacillus xanthanilyticus]|uniref:Nicotianamine synthase family protein n=1 Tax=Paenibacillus xanthanilyticus TaxID=1783531 RepID=A0ABV8K277_9BACL
MDRDLSVSEGCASEESRDQIMTNFITYIREVYELLERERDLTPSNLNVTALIEHLKQQLLLPFSPVEVREVLSSPHIQRIYPLLLAKLSECERHAELFYARELCQSDHQHGLDRMKQLPSWSIYEALVGQEVHFIRKFTRPERIRTPIVFVGSGPMPLSAVLLHLYTAVDVICLEKDEVAFETSRRLLQRLGLADNVKVVHENGETFDYSACRRVFIASLVTDKKEVLRRIKRTAPDPLVAVRTAEGMRQLMYESVDEAQLEQAGWRLLGRSSPKEGLVVNSTLFMEQRD